MNIRLMKKEKLPKKDHNWWKRLQSALNVNGENEFMSKEAVDDYDHRVKEGLGVLQILVM